MTSVMQLNDVSAPFARTSIRELQRMLVLWSALREALWQLFSAAENRYCARCIIRLPA